MSPIKYIKMLPVYTIYSYLSVILIYLENADHALLVNPCACINRVAQIEYCMQCSVQCNVSMSYLNH